MSGPAGPPTEAELRAMPVHILVRDFPEAMAVLREAGIDVPAVGGRPVAEAAPDAGPLVDALQRGLAWRAEAAHDG